MKTKTIIAAAIAFAAVFVWCCGKDEITDFNQNAQNPSTDPDTGQYDYIDSVWFNRTISVVFSPSGQATVTGATSDFAVTISGNGVTIVNNGSDKVRYELSGSTQNGFLKIYSGKRQALIFNSVSITNPTGSAINIQGLPDSLSKAKRTFVVLNGSNALGDGVSYLNTPSNEDEKAAFFSESPLIFSGSGSLTVTAIGKSGIATDDYLRINEGDITVNMTSAAKVISGDTLKPACLKGKEEFIIVGGNLTLNSSGTGGKGISGDSIATFAGGTVMVNVSGANFGSTGSSGGFPRPGQQSSNGVSAKGIKFDKGITFSGCNVSVSCSSHEGIESKGTITISGGVVYSYSSADDAINASSDLYITGGLVGAYSTSNDALDANGNLYIRGGVVYAVTTAGGAELAVDANTEGGKRLYVEGGTFVSIGGLERGASLTQSCYKASSITAGTWYSITIGSTTYAFKTPNFSTSGSGYGPGGGSSNSRTLVVSGNSQPTVKSGVTVNGGTNYFDSNFNVDGTVSGGSGVTLTNYSGY